jgi:YihY family inner membrane protein
MTSTITNTDFFENLKKESKPYRLFFQKFQHDWSLVLSCMLAFNLLIALLPMAIILFGILGLILGNNLNLQNRIKTSIINTFPPKANDGLREIINLAFDKLYHDAKIILIFGIFFAIIGCLRLFVAIDRSLTIIYRIKERTFLKKYILACQMLFLFLLLIPLMIIASSTPSILLDNIPNAGSRFGTYILGFLTSLSITFLLFELIYLLIPNKKMKFKQTWCGSIIAAGALQLFMILFPLYIRKYMTSYTGQIGFFVILILFLFYFAIILILGAQINAFFFEHIQPLPVPLGTFVSTLANEYHETEAREPFNV